MRSNFPDVEEDKEKEKKELAILQSYKRLAEQGYVQAQIKLGYIYELGEGVPKDQKLAMHYFKLAADQGNAEAQNNTGIRYQKGGDGIPKNLEKAAYYYGLAAKQGNTNAQVSLAKQYEFGQGVEKNEKEAARLYQLSEQKNLQAQVSLGLMYGTGRGVEKDEKKAQQLLQPLTKQIKIKSGVISIDEIKKNEHRDTYIPEAWPLPINQRDKCCGLYALYIALIYFYGESMTIPPVRKNGDKKIVSLRAMAKERKLSLVGEIPDVHTFSTLMNDLKISNCEVINDKSNISQENYIKTILQHVNSEKKSVVIASCNAIVNGFPENTNKFDSHWLLIFGSYFDNETNKYMFLATQYGEYYSLDAEELYQSNNSIPDADILRKSDPELIKTEMYSGKDSWKKRWEQEKEKLKKIPYNERPYYRMNKGLFAIFGSTEKDKTLDKKPSSLCKVQVF